MNDQLKSHELTVKSITDEYFKAIDMAKDDRDPSAMVLAITGLAKLHGFSKEKYEIEISGINPKFIPAILNNGNHKSPNNGQ